MSASQGNNQDNAAQVPIARSPVGLPLRACYKGTFAYTTVKDRLPVILAKLVDQLCREKESIWKQLGDESKSELKQAIGCLSQLRNEIQTNKLLTPVTSKLKDGLAWNVALDEEEKKEGRKLTWFDARWLFIENYMYRRVWEAFQESHLQSYDYFGPAKREGYVSGTYMMPMIAELSHLNRAEIASTERRKVFSHLLETSLWSNSYDLSFTGGDISEAAQNLEKQMKSNHDKILANDWEKAWNILNTTTSNSDASLGIVLDNAGIEIFTDFCLADLLFTTGRVSSVVFYVKSMPWYVSDVTDEDISWTIHHLKAETNPLLKSLGSKWDKYMCDGKWSVTVDPFWTLPYDFSEMKVKDRSLYQKLENHKLVVFKGDLNYRKLMGDIRWSTHDKFGDALRNFCPTNLLAIRTMKAEVVVGIPDIRAQQLDRVDPEWMVSGKYGVIQVYEKTL